MPHTPLLPTKGWAEHWDNTSPHPITFSVKRGSGEKPHSVPPPLPGHEKGGQLSG